jgi:outer membrane protein assembly factor BamB
MRVRVALLLLCLLATPAVGGDWPRLRGPGGTGQAPDADPPSSWSFSEDGGENIAWRVPVPGRGFSSPVVLDGVLWLTTAHEERRALHLLAFDAATGELLHDLPLFHPEAWQEGHPENSYASPTPVLEPGRVYAHFGTYGTAAVDSRSGEMLWRVVEPLRIEHEVGPGSSPILYGGLLILTCDGTDRQFLAALDKNTGKVVWTTDRGLDLERNKPPHRKAFTTPLVVEYQGEEQLISPGADQMVAYRPSTGEPLWRVAYEGYSNVAQPVVGFGKVFVSTGYMKPLLLAIHLGGRGDVTTSRVVWSYRWQVPANPTPLLLGDRLFLVSDHGNATWLDAHQGTDLWRQRLGGRHYASPLATADRIYTFDLQGESHILAIGDTFRELGQGTLPEAIYATPAIDGDALIVRTLSHLYRIESKAPSAANSP